MQTASMRHSPRPGGFGGKIILMVLVIVAVSQGLGTFLSVLSFEDIYLKALISKYEILGKDLNRQIEQALKFGKPLDRFLGMDRLVAALFRRADELGEVSVFDPDGRPLFCFKKAETVMARMVVDDKDESRGRVLLDHEEPLSFLSMEGLDDPQGTWPVVRVSRGRYHLVFPIQVSFSGLQGYLELAFDRSILDAKKWELVRRSLAKLLIAVALTWIAVALLIRFLFVNPARRQAERSEVLLFETGGEGPVAEDSRPVSEEILRVRRAIEGYMALTVEVRTEVSARLEHLEHTLPDGHPDTHVIRLMKDALSGEDHEDD